MKKLTEKENLYLELYAAGDEFDQIASENGVQRGTVTDTFRKLREQFGVESNEHLIWRVYNLGMIKNLPHMRTYR